VPQTFTYDVLPGGEPVAAGRHQRLVLRAGPELSPGEGRTPLVPVARRWQAHRGRLDEALTAEICRQAVRLTIDATDLRFADLASMRTLVTGP
jgi:hypothetical protein